MKKKGDDMGSCIHCKTGVYEQIGEIRDINKNKVFVYTKLKTESGIFQIFVCSNPKCGNMKITANKDFLYNIRHMFRTETVLPLENII